MKILTFCTVLLCAATSFAQYSVKVDPQYIGFGTHLRADSVYVAYFDVTSIQDVGTFVHLGSGHYGDTAQQERWCSFEPLNFALAARATQRVRVSVHLRDSSGLKFAQYFPIHTFADGVTPDASFLVMQVTAKSLNTRPRHLIAPDTVDFGEVHMGQSVERFFIFYSPDSASIAFDREPPGYEYFAPGEYNLSPITDSVKVTVTFSPLGYGERTTLMEVTGNTDPENRFIFLRAHVDSALASVSAEVQDNGDRAWIGPDYRLQLTLRTASHVDVSNILGDRIYSGDMTSGIHELPTSGASKFCIVRIVRIVRDDGTTQVLKLARE